VVHADLGAETADGGFCSLADLGWGAVRFPLDPALAGELARRATATVGAVLTVSMVTGTGARAEALLAAHPDALAEGMEGIGVYQAAARAGVPFAEVRAISNQVGPRDRDSWQVEQALAALSRAFDGILAEPLPGAAT
jgi:futalosine hydrolase